MKRAVLRFTAAVLVMTMCSACYRVSYQIAPPSPRGDLYMDQRWNNYFIFGFVPSNEEFQFNELCPGGELKEVNLYRTPGNVLASLLSAGLSAASTVEVSCLVQSAGRSSGTGGSSMPLPSFSR